MGYVQEGWRSARSGGGRFRSRSREWPEQEMGRSREWAGAGMGKRSTGRPTLADVAQRAGMSKAAVSMVLNDRPGSRVSADAARRIRRLRPHSTTVQPRRTEPAPRYHSNDRIHLRRGDHHPVRVGNDPRSARRRPRQRSHRADVRDRRPARHRQCRKSNDRPARRRPAHRPPMAARLIDALTCHPACRW